MNIRINFTRMLHIDESASAVTGYVMVFTVALILLLAMFFIANWEMSTEKKHNDEAIDIRKEANTYSKTYEMEKRE